MLAVGRTKRPLTCSCAVRFRVGLLVEPLTGKAVSSYGC